jgi:hypothetical protein
MTDETQKPTVTLVIVSTQATPIRKVFLPMKGSKPNSAERAKYLAVPKRLRLK